MQWADMLCMAVPPVILSSQTAESAKQPYTHTHTLGNCTVLLQALCEQPQCDHVCGVIRAAQTHPQFPIVGMFNPCAKEKVGKASCCERIL